MATGFELLADEARYTVAVTGVTHDVGVIPIDSATKWQASKGDLQFSGTKVEAQLFAAQMPPGWTGPGLDARGKGADTLIHKGRRYRVEPVREELNRVWVVELITA